MSMIDLPREQWEKVLFNTLDENCNRARIQSALAEREAAQKKRISALRAVFVFFGVLALIVVILAAMDIVSGWFLAAPLICCLLSAVGMMKED